GPGAVGGSGVVGRLTEVSGDNSASGGACGSLARDPLNHWITQKNTGVKKMPNSVTPSIPLNTANPSDRRISAPAPLAIATGTTPRMNAKLVMRIGRSRSFDASKAACQGSTPAS